MGRAVWRTAAARFIVGQSTAAVVSSLVGRAHKSADKSLRIA